MKEDKSHWYDGWFYDKFVAPNQDKLFRQIENLIESNSKVIDVGCGTGRFSFLIADKSKTVLGIDPSKRNIARAKLSLSQKPNNKISFENSTLSQLLSEREEHFDYAVSTYVLHEINENERADFLENISLIAEKIIIGDYLYPDKAGLLNLFNRVVEFAAGRNHYKNYRNFMARGGIKKFASEAGLKVVAENKDQPLTSHLVVLSK
jgi:SAM-dependent methyltransferase